MITRVVRVQVLLFTVIALVGITFVGARYARLDQLFGGSGYTVKVRLADSGGIFTNAEVTYRGVAIGRVGELHLVDDGIEVDLRIDSGAPPVPSDVDVAVANRSAVGEQYLDLRPRRDGEPYLTEGSVVRQDRTTLPLPVEQVVRNLDRLVASVPEEDLRTVVDELYDATQDTGPSLQVLLDSTASFTDLATEHLPQTLQLITDAGPVLTTQIEQSDAIKSFGVNAKLIAEQLRTSDADLRRLLSTGPAVARQVSELIRETGPTLGVLLGNLLTTSTVLLTQRDGVEQLLVVTPAAVSAASTALRPGNTEVGLTTTFFTPLPCTQGYEGTTYRNGRDTSPAPLNTAARCTR
ncbi:MlaD family protein [Actinophytocola sp.]|uniref:MlaD family protein n=1 Tax=Actinophytocola sp. TaxID=1872138 RepID=UPI002D7E2910|nr:MlaD family protein [Actinophytocola sp.]HET9141608.1 MlaD family protein [Actinophytocola sp.]